MSAYQYAFVFIAHWILIHVDSKPCPYDGDFRCGDGVCIRSDFVCNRHNNCRDGSDEVNCSKYYNYCTGGKIGWENFM